MNLFYLPVVIKLLWYCGALSPSHDTWFSIDADSSSRRSDQITLVLAQNVARNTRRFKIKSKNVHATDNSFRLL